jgi:hypothetical protein
MSDRVLQARPNSNQLGRVTAESGRREELLAGVVQRRDAFAAAARDVDGRQVER